MRVGGHQKSTKHRSLVGFSIAFLMSGNMGYVSDGVVESTRTTTAYVCDMMFREHTGKCKIEL